MTQFNTFADKLSNYIVWQLDAEMSEYIQDHKREVWEGFILSDNAKPILSMWGELNNAYSRGI